MSKTDRRQAGFTYIELLIAIVILTVGILAMLSALTASLMRSYESEKRTTAKQIVVSTLESIVSAKEIQKFHFDSIRNDSAPTLPHPDNPSVTISGVFLSGWRPIRQDSGGDGVAGTADDACPASSACVVPPSPPNNSEVVEGFLREVVITDVDDPERPFPTYRIGQRRIDVRVQFSVNGNLREEKMSTMITNFKE